MNPTELDTVGPFFFESHMLPYTIIEFSDDAQPSPMEPVSISYTPSCVP